MLERLLFWIRFHSSNNSAHAHIFKMMYLENSKYLRMTGVLDSIELGILRMVDCMRDCNTFGESDVQSYRTPSILMLDGVWVDKQSTALSNSNLVEPKTLFTSKYLVVL